MSSQYRLQPIFRGGGNPLRHLGAQFEIIMQQFPSQGCQLTSLWSLAADLGFDQRLSQRLLGLFNSRPDVTVTAADLRRRGFDRMRSIHSGE